MIEHLLLDNYSRMAMGMTVTCYTRDEFRRLQKKLNISHNYYQSEAGLLRIACTDLGVHEAVFCDDSCLGTEIDSKQLNVKKLVLVGTEFQCMVWQAVLQIPAGSVTSYQAIADAIGHPRAYRAAANAIANNPIAYFVPCHRVLLKSGQLCGYNWGVEKKRALLMAEGCRPL